MRSKIVKCNSMPCVVVSGDSQLVLRRRGQSCYAEYTLGRLHAVWYETPLEFINFNVYIRGVDIR